MIKFWFANLIVLIFGLGALISPLPNRRLHDFAQLLSSSSASKLEASLFQIEKETTAQVAVVTVESLGGLSVDEYARQLLNEWGIGQENVNNGVLFLIAASERRTRIEVGYGLEGLITDGIAGEILDTEVVPKFKEGDYEGGIIRGTEALIELLRKYPQAARGIAGSKPLIVLTKRKTAQLIGYGSLGVALVFFVVAWRTGKSRRYSKVVFFLGLAGILSLLGFLYLACSQLPIDSIPLGTTGGAVGSSVLALFYNIRRYRRYRPHFCKECKSELRLLSETEDDAKLSEAEKLEEKLSSVDYDVWVCPACLKDHKEEYNAFLSNFKECPKCQVRAYSETSATVIPATTSSTGLQNISGECKHCFHKTKRQAIIPRIQRSSGSSSGGSSGGGFGGGSSGGGGASRGW